MKIYQVEVRETHRRFVYIYADDPKEAERLARDPAEWADDEKASDSEFRVYTNSAKEVDLSAG